MTNVDLIFGQSCGCCLLYPVHYCTRILFSFDQNMRILNIFDFPPPVLPPTALNWIGLSIITWSAHLSDATLLLVFIKLFQIFISSLKGKKIIWVFLYWKTIFNFAKEDLMWWFWRATSWVLTHSIQLSWSSGATGIAREIKLTLKILMIQTLVFSANLTKIDKFFLICLIYFLYNSYIWYRRGSGISNNIARFSIP